MDFDTAVVRVATGAETLELQVEVAERPEQRQHGLMERTSLGEDQGMIFLFAGEQHPDDPFYMFRTRIPLDIAFIDGSGQIVAVLGMDPCESPNPQMCRRYAPGKAYVAALEVNRGYFERHGVTPGARVELIRPDGERWP